MRRILVAAIAWLAAACAVGPTYQRPAAPTPPAFKEPPPEGWKTAQPNEAVPRGAWWQIYRDPLLNDLEAQVSISNQNVLAAMARYREARDQVRIARASLFPLVTTAPAVTASRASATFGRGSGVSGTNVGTGSNAGTGSNVVGFSSGTVVDYTLPVDISYQADVWGSIRRSVRAAGEIAQASAADLENARLTYQAQLAQLYFELHGLDGDANLLQATIALYQQSLELTKNRLAAGVASGADVAFAETQLAVTRAQLIDVGIARAQFEHAIATLMGRPPSDVSIPVAVLTTPPPPIPPGVPSSLLERRPDIASTERTVAAANEQIGIAEAAFFPSLLLSATGGFQTTQFVEWLTWPSRFWSVGPQVATTLFDAGRRRAQVHLSEAAYDAAAATYRQTVLTALQQVEDQLAALRILEQEAAAAADAVRAAQETLDIINAQYTAGTTDYLQVIVAQTASLNTQRTAIDILARRLTASVLLIEALGGGWDSP